MANIFGPYAEKLEKGETVQFRPKGASMTPRIHSGQLVTVSPIKKEELEKGDIVLCKVRGRCYLHKISAIQGERFQISNNHGHINGWATEVYGKVTKVED